MEHRGIEREPITDLLLAYERGVPGAFDRLVAVVYAVLQRVAHRHRKAKGRPDDAVLDTGALVQEATCKLLDGRGISRQDRRHFLAAAARAMRQVIIDHARARRAQKRGNASGPVPLGREAAVHADADRILAVNEALSRLGKADARMLRVVECRFFAGYTEAETADVLSVSAKTVERDWVRARAWLRTTIDNRAALP